MVGKLVIFVFDSEHEVIHDAQRARYCFPRPSVRTWILSFKEKLPSHNDDTDNFR